MSGDLQVNFNALCQTREHIYWNCVLEVARLLWFLDLAINCGRKFPSQEQKSKEGSAHSAPEQNTAGQFRPFLRTTH